MSPTCGCCKKWVSHLENNGFEVESIYEDNMRSIKTQYKISQKNTSCHTGIIGSYFIEGHVPASDIKELLEKQPDIAGLTVPGMPAGINVPGMETINEKAEYDVLYVRKDGSIREGVRKIKNSQARDEEYQSGGAYRAMIKLFRDNLDELEKNKRKV